MNDESLSALIADYRPDPVRFASDLLGIEAREEQPEMLEAYTAHDRVAVAACRNAGKSTAAEIAAVHFLVTEPGSAVLVNTPTSRQCDYFMEGLGRIWQGAPLRHALPDWQLLNYELRTTVKQSRLLATSAESGADWLEGFQAARNVLLILDECKAIPDAIIDSCFQILGGHEVAKVFAISTPGRPQGRFYEFFTKHAARWKTMSISAADIPRLRAHYEEQRGEHEGDPFFQQQLEGRFADVEEGDSVFSYESVRLATERGRLALAAEEPSPWQRMVYGGVRPQVGVLGLDPAGRGRDKSIACYRRGPNVLGLYDVGGRDEMDTVARVARLATQLRVQRVTVDVGGLGGPMQTRLAQILERPDRFEKVEVHPFNSAWRPQDGETYASAKSEVAFRVRRALREGRISLPADPVLVSQLTGYSWQVDSRGRIRLIDPSPSPDRGDALLVSFADPVVSVQSVRVRGL